MPTPLLEIFYHLAGLRVNLWDAGTRCYAQALVEEAMATTPGWIEVHNRILATVNLQDWSLTDDPTQPDKWRIDEVTIAPGAHLVALDGTRGIGEAQHGQDKCGVSPPERSARGVKIPAVPGRVFEEFFARDLNRYELVAVEELLHVT